jgi:hypothetical protein
MNGAAYLACRNAGGCAPQFAHSSVDFRQVPRACNRETDQEVAFSAEPPLRREAVLQTRKDLAAP